MPAGDILKGNHTDPFTRLMEFQIDRAQRLYGQALKELPAVDRKSQKSGLIMAAIYRTMLDEIQRDGCRVLTHRTGLTPLRKLWIAWRTSRNI